LWLHDSICTRFKRALAGKNYWKNLDKIELSDREKEIIQYSIRGYAINEIAEKLFISPDTVKFHRKKMFEKMDVANISEAISYATVNKLV
jgi:DNA-binding CsgD family transcriptional regulator